MKQHSLLRYTVHSTQYSLLIIYSLLISLFLNSCQREETEYNIKTTTPVNQIYYSNNRFVFKTKEEFVKKYKESVNLSDELLFKNLKQYYDQGFLSLRPIISEENEKYIFDHYKELLSNKSNLDDQFLKRTSEDIEDLDYFDQIEDVIGDDTFSLFLNSNGEIQIGEDIYKYTDVGLFICNIENYEELNNYILSKNISQNLTEATSPEAKNEILNEFPQSGLTMVNNEISYYRITTEESEINDASLPNTSINQKFNITSKSTTTDPSYLAFLSNLQECEEESGLFGNLFGDNNVCIDRYETRRRVKTKAFNYDYLLVYHLGVKCVHQYRGWTGLWRVEATDEIRLIVEAAQFEYDADKLLNQTLSFNQLQEKLYYINDTKILYQPNSITLNGFTYTNLNQSNLAPIFQNTGKGLTFEFFETGSNELNNLIQNGINSSLNAKKVNEYFYNGLYQYITSQLKVALNNSNFTPPENRTFVSKFPKSGKVIIQKSVHNSGNNIGVRENTFDFGGEIKLSGADDGSGAWNISQVGPGNQLTRPKDLRFKLIGAARHGNGWHGSKFQDGIE